MLARFFSWLGRRISGFLFCTWLGRFALAMTVLLLLGSVPGWRDAVREVEHNLIFLAVFLVIIGSLLSQIGSLNRRTHARGLAGFLQKLFRRR